MGWITVDSAKKEHEAIAKMEGLSADWPKVVWRTKKMPKGWQLSRSVQMPSSMRASAHVPDKRALARGAFIYACPTCEANDVLSALQLTKDGQHCYNCGEDFGDGEGTPWGERQVRRLVAGG